MRLIDVEKLKQYIDDCECCEKCDTKGFMCNEDCELPDCVTPQWERVLNEQPTIDAVPVEFIEKRAKAYGDKAEQCEGTEFIYPYLSERILNLLIAEWSDRKEK